MRDFFELMPWWLWTGIAAFFALIIWVAIAETNAWNEFSAKNHCKVVGQSSGSYSTGFGTGFNGQGGMVTTYTPGKTGYSCDDGVTYWR